MAAGLKFDLRPIVVIFLAGCGATTNDPVPLPGGPGSGVAPSFCYGGTVIPATATRPQLCRTTRDLWSSFMNAFYLTSNPPRLTPSNPLSQASTTLPLLTLEAGDVIEWQATGRWDKWNSSGCHNYRDLEGYQGSSQAINEGMPQGLLATDGYDTILLGHSAIWDVQNTGVLYLGFNMSTWSTSCWEVYPTVFRHSRCTDVAGTIYPCP